MSSVPMAQKVVAWNILLIGPPGAGKSSQAKMLEKEIGTLKHISTGDLLREEKVLGSDVGTYVHHADVQKLALKLTFNEIIKVKKSPNGPENPTGIILDLSSRTASGAKKLDKLLHDEGLYIDIVIELSIPEDQLIERISRRLVHIPSGRIYHEKVNPPKVPMKDDITGEDLFQRKEDNPEGLKRRLASYNTYADALRNYYKQEGGPAFFTIDTSRGLDDVFKDIKDIVTNFPGPQNVEERKNRNYEIDEDEGTPEELNNIVYESDQVNPLELAEVRKSIIELTNSTKRNNFPGTQPTTLSKVYINEHINKHQYQVAIKADGIRYFLYFSAKNNAIYFVNRKFKVYKSNLPLDIDFRGDTLVDGELVILSSDQTRRVRYIVFDSLVVEGKNVMKERLTDRLLDVQGSFVVPLSTHLGKKHNILHFEITMQLYFPASDVENALEASTSLPYDTDGLIFMPVALGYKMGFANQVFKWKPPSKTTIDYQIRQISEQGKTYYELLVMSANGLTVFDFIEDNNPEFPLEKHVNSIAECMWDPKMNTHVLDIDTRKPLDRIGGWKIQRIRTDKLTPNGDWVARGLIDTVKEALDESQLSRLIEKKANAPARPGFRQNRNSPQKSNSNNNRERDWKKNQLKEEEDDSNWMTVGQGGKVKEVAPSPRKDNTNQKQYRINQPQNKTPNRSEKSDWRKSP